jgi:hypothetical protein
MPNQVRKGTNNVSNGELRMKKTREKKPEKFILEIPRIKLNSKEMDALQAAVKVLTEQSEQLGLLEPLEAEPAILFFAEEGKR